ncbi:glycosyl hydrolase family 95 catalytic domain-containing protein [Flavitalea flava]
MQKVLLKIFGSTLTGVAILASGAHAQMRSPDQIIGKYKNVFSSPPSKTPGRVAVDGPLLGNGSVAVVIAGEPEQQVYYLARNDFWRLKSGYNESFPAVLGKLQIDIPLLKSASYKVQQDLYNATTITDFTKGDVSVHFQSEVAATKDWLIIEIKNNGKKSIEGKAALLLPQADQFYVNPPLENKFPDSTSSGNNEQGVQWIQRGFINDVSIQTQAAAAIKIIGKSSNVFWLRTGEKIVMVCALSSNFKDPDCLQSVLKQAQHTSFQMVKNVRNDHQVWWRQFWNESFVNIEDSIIEHQYYRSQYNLASCSRDPTFPPGIFGSWTTREIPNWNGDYHLNYNYTAPFYGLLSSNHLRQAMPYYEPLLAFIQRGKYYSEKIAQIPDGVLYPVGIGPLGIETTRKNKLMNYKTEDEGLFFGQKSNAAYCAVPMSMHFYKTYDYSFTKHVYPFIRSVAIFWQQYLKKEGDRYIIENDAIHEGTYGTVNPILSLGLVPMILRTAFDMSVLLNTDTALREDWKEKMNHLSEYTLQVRNGKTVFRYSEKGTDWWDDNTLGIQHIYPAGQIGMESDSNLLQIARNTITVMNRWMDINGSNSFFPAAVRVGYNADTIFAKLHDYSLHTYPNGFQLNNPHGIENCSTVPNTINEMLCMSNQKTLRVFAVWPKEKYAAFSNIRCDGAFLVSSELQNNTVKYLKIVSEKGLDCVIKNPWEGKTFIIKSTIRKGWKQNGEKITVPTLAGEILFITQE